MATNNLPSFDMLLEQSAALMPRADVPGFPRLNRNLEQIEDTTRQLRAKTSRLEAPKETNAAARLLAGEGFKLENLSRGMRNFDMQTTFEEAFPVEGTTIEEYLQQVHDLSLSTAIEKENHTSMQTFESFMLDCAEADWEKHHQLYNFGSGVAPVTPQAPTGMAKAAVVAPVGMVESYPRQAVYAKVMKDLNTARLSRKEAEMDVCKAFQEAAETECGPSPIGQGQTTIVSCWQLMHVMMGSLPKGPIHSVGADLEAQMTSALVQGSRSYLEQCHAAYLTTVISKNVTVARLGDCQPGDPPNLAKVKAFLRMVLQGQGQLDFDLGSGTGAGIPTTWKQVYLCLRSGFYAEALHVAHQPHAADVQGLDGGVNLVAALEEWVRDGSVEAGKAARLSQQCRRMLALGAGQAGGGAQHHLLALYAMLSGDWRTGQELRKHAPSFFDDIHGFMWFQLCMVREHVPVGSVTPTYAGAPPDPYTVQHLQRYLNKYPAKHYTREGREPLTYVTVLMLSLQFRAALRYLLHSPSTQPFRADAVHLAVALIHHRVLLNPSLHLEPADPAQGGLPGHWEAEASRELWKSVAIYSKDVFGPVDPVAALEYSAYAAHAAELAALEPSSSALKLQADLFSGLLQDRGAAEKLVGRGGVAANDSPLARFVPAEANRRLVVVGAGDVCRGEARFEEALALYRAAGEYAGALAITNHQLADLLARAPQTLATSERVRALRAEGAALRDAAFSARDGSPAAAAGGGGALQAEVDCFEQLQLSADLLAARDLGAAPDVLRLLRQLRCLPLDHVRVQPCIAQVPHLSPPLLLLLPTLVQVGATTLSTALSNAQRRDQRTLVMGQAPSAEVENLREQLSALTEFVPHVPMPESVLHQMAALAPVGWVPGSR